MKKTIELTREQINTLACYILMTTQHRKGEREAWEKLAREVDENGNPVFENARSNADYYAKLESKLEEIKEILDSSY
jgi:hypothetical protein